MYKLSKLAAEDFEQIFEYSLLNFGVEQADDYTRSLEAVFLVIAQHPFMGRECAEVATGLRRHDHNKHVIFYRPIDKGIFVVRILHQQMSLNNAMSGN
jgi:toxin ParE1/3/4